MYLINVPPKASTQALTSAYFFSLDCAAPVPTAPVANEDGVSIIIPEVRPLSVSWISNPSSRERHGQQRTLWVKFMPICHMFSKIPNQPIQQYGVLSHLRSPKPEYNRKQGRGRLSCWGRCCRRTEWVGR